MFLKIKGLPVSQFMTAYPISVESNVSFKIVVDFMAERGFANVIITEKEKTIGIFTEREILKHIVSKDADPKTPIKEIGKQPYEEVDPGISIFDASKIMTAKNSRLLIFAESKKLVGIITSTDMLRAFQKTDDDPPIKSFISKNLAMCNSKTSIKELITNSKVFIPSLKSIISLRSTSFSSTSYSSEVFCLVPNPIQF